MGILKYTNKKYSPLQNVESILCEDIQRKAQERQYRVVMMVSKNIDTTEKENCKDFYFNLIELQTNLLQKMQIFSIITL